MSAKFVRNVITDLFSDPLQLRGRKLSSECQSLGFAGHLLEEVVSHTASQREELSTGQKLVSHTLECLHMRSIC